VIRQKFDIQPIYLTVESKQKPNLSEAVNQEVVEICGVVISSFINANDKKPLFSISLKIDILDIVNHFKDRDGKL
jgi:hypothetical protein